MDVGTSGGVFGLDRGYCLMIGGPDDAAQYLDPVFRALAPGKGTAAAPRVAKSTPARRRKAICTVDLQGPATSSKWCTTGSSTE